MALGKDLSTIRKEKNLTLEDVYSVTKIPIHTLESIEKDTFLNQIDENKTYLRSFVRSYAKALKITDEHILAAIEATEAGIYNQDLVRLNNPDTAPKELNDNIEQTSSASDENNIESESDDKSSTNNAEKPAVNITFTDPTRARSPKSAPTVETVNWADMSRKVSSTPTNPKVYLGVLVVVFFIIAASATYYYSENILSFFSTEEVTDSENSALTDSEKEDTEAVNDSTFTSSVESIVPINNSTPSIVEPDYTSTFGDTLKIVLYAAFDKLDPVRITSDFNWRTNPFWMNQGEASYFEFKDSLLIRGQYSKMLIMFNNHVIENPRQNFFDSEYNSILLTREVLDQPQYRGTSPQGFPANVTPPDSIANLIRY
tara:strand:- start:4801 stop:5916 length:1116 start_codon:yes stop_codon:yes gene_type:complete